MPVIVLGLHDLLFLMDFLNYVFIHASLATTLRKKGVVKVLLQLFE